MIDERSVPPWVNQARLIGSARRRRRIERWVSRHYLLLLYATGALVFVLTWLALDALNPWAPAR